jgi:hypothetical protein
MPSQGAILSQLHKGVSGMNTSDQVLEEVFTAKEIARLRIYRAAIAAGFYTDDLPPSNEEDLTSDYGVSVMRGQSGEIVVLIVANAGRPGPKEGRA